MRPYMEDRHISIPDFALTSSAGLPLPHDGVRRSYTAVFDGHNGPIAAEHAVDRLHHLLAGEPALRGAAGEGPPAALAREEEVVAAALTRAFEATDREILTRCRVEGVRGGTTAVVALRLGEEERGAAGRGQERGRG